MIIPISPAWFIKATVQCFWGYSGLYGNWIWRQKYNCGFSEWIKEGEGKITLNIESTPTHIASSNLLTMEWDKDLTSSRAQ